MRACGADSVLHAALVTCKIVAKKRTTPDFPDVVIDRARFCKHTYKRVEGGKL